MTFSLSVTEPGKPSLVLEQCLSRLAALPLLQFHRRRLQEQHPLDTLWLRDDVNTDAYFLVYRKVYLAAASSLSHLKEKQAYLCRLEIQFIE